MPHLVLTRGVDERVVIRHKGAEIVVTVKGFVGRQVRIDFEAPPKVKINREELQTKIDTALREKYKHFPHNLTHIVAKVIKALLP